ncbi:MAG TPA: helix-turn-helix transcriptional regulator [Tepidisphaeraceae bacterium]|jgi:DNA-binding CsgD family transcriptional regulator|nr:helix-turn-helix transcriptional regulator [Tepidisphaeraceae bacterium]
MDWLYHPNGGASASHPEIDGLTERQRQTLDRLLAGDSEKEAAAALGLSPHTVHVYVKSLYRTFQVNTRNELLAKFIGGKRE